MQELREWLHRIATIDGSQPPESVLLRSVLKRVAAPTSLDFDESVIRIEDTGTEVHLFGNVPARLSVLQWPDLADRGDLLSDINIATQLGAVMSMATGRRVRVASAETPLNMEGTQQYTFLPAIVTDRELSGPLPADAKEQIETLLGLVGGLSEEDAGPIGSSLDLHYAAIVLHDVDLNAAYALTVAGIETLADSYGSYPRDWDKWDQASRFEAAFEKAGLSDVQRAVMKTALMHEKHLGLRQRFASYACDRLPRDFWTTTVQDYTPSLTMRPDGSTAFTGPTSGETWPIERFVPQDKDVLRRRLLATYDARSTYVHAGRRTVTTMTTMQAAIGDPVARKSPLDFIGLRRVLHALIKLELAERATPGQLPAIRLQHGVAEN